VNQNAWEIHFVPNRIKHAPSSLRLSNRASWRG
jgi:hypothetical protein